MNVSPVPSAVLAIALLFAASTNAEQIYGLGFPSNEGTFNVIEGKPYLLRQGERGSPGNAVDIKTNGKLMHYMSQKPLAYPLDGENPVIRLGKEYGVPQVFEVPRCQVTVVGTPATACILKHAVKFRQIQPKVVTIEIDRS